MQYKVCVCLDRHIVLDDAGDVCELTTVRRRTRMSLSASRNAASVDQPTHRYVAFGHDIGRDAGAESGQLHIVARALLAGELAYLRDGLQLQVACRRRNGQ